MDKKADMSMVFLLASQQIFTKIENKAVNPDPRTREMR
jgi:hypothetical protein